ncbi:MAG TPA: PAS domain S-box protein, partial [Polyangia bacterium]
MEQNLIAAALVDATSDGVLAFDLQCRYTLWNPVMERISGLSAAQVIGQHAFTLFPFLVEFGEDRLFRDALAGRSGSSHERPFVVHQTGREGLFEGRYSPLRDAEGNVVGGLGIIRDVTAVRDARERGEAMKLHFRVLESMKEGVSVSDASGTIIYTNAAEDRMFGYQPGELIGKHVSVQNHDPPEENQRRVDEVIATLKRDGVWVGEWRNRRKDGTPFLTRAHITVFESEGKPLWVCVQEDITQEKASLEAIRQSNEQLSLALAAAHLGTWSWNAERDEVTLSPEAAAIFDFPAGVPLPWSALAAVVPPEDTEARLAARTAAIRNRAPVDIEYRVNRPGGVQAWVAVKGRTLFDGDKLRGMLGVVQDISQQKRSEQALLDEARVVETVNRIGQALSGELDQQRLLQALTDAA